MPRGAILGALLVCCASLSGAASVGATLESGDVGALEALLQSGGVDVNAGIEYDGRGGMTPLMIACKLGVGPPMIDAILAAGGNVDAIDSDGGTALGYASLQGDAAVVNRLVALSAGVRESGAKALAGAVVMGHTDIVRTLLGAGAADGSRQSHNLIQASVFGHADIVKLLLAKVDDIDVDTLDNDGNTALMGAAAAFLTRREGAQYLDNMQAEARVSTPIQREQEEWVAYYVEAARALLEFGAEIDIQDNQDYSALMYASNAGIAEIVELFLAYDADLELKNTMGATALDIARSRKKGKIVGLLEAAAAGGQAEFVDDARTEL